MLFAVHLAERKLAPQAIKSYIAAARNMHIGLGVPRPVQPLIHADVTTHTVGNKEDPRQQADTNSAG